MGPLHESMVGTPQSAFSRSEGHTITPVRPLVSNSPLTRAWTPIVEAGSLWARVRAPFARRRYAREFDCFRAFVQAFSNLRRPLHHGEPQAMADDAVLLGLLDVDPTFCVANGTSYQLVPAYKRRRSEVVFREWLVIYERRNARQPAVRYFL
jgi:hypothetical protein